MVVAVALLTLMLIASFIYIYSLTSRSPAAVAPKSSASVGADIEARVAHLASELKAAKKVADERAAELRDVRDELKSTKKKLHATKEEDHVADQLKKDRIEVERAASIQLEATRAELATALSEIEKLRAAGSTATNRRPPSRAAAESTETAEESPRVTRVIRELSEAEKQRIERLEYQAAKDRAALVELEKQLKAAKGQRENVGRQAKDQLKQLDLLKDKFRALEKRANRLVLERDLMLKAIRQLEKMTGTAAGRFELTDEEAKASDEAVDLKQRADSATTASTEPSTLDAPTA